MKCQHCYSWSCGLRQWAGTILWTLSVVALLMAWAASTSPTGLFMKLPVAHLFWDALILGVLAIGCRSDKCHGWGGCNGVCSSEDEGEMMENKEEKSMPPFPSLRKGRNGY